MRKNKGITLIALVVTIIVLLILAGISIASLTGTNGIITRVNEARTEHVRGTEKEQISLAYTAEKSILLEQGNIENVTAENLENRLRIDGAKVTSVKEEDESLKVTFDTGNTYYVDINGNIIEWTPPEPPLIGEVEKPTEETEIQFSKMNGVIEIAWLDNYNNVINNPMKITETDLGGMTPVKWDGTPGKYEEKTTDISDKNWYQYIAQAGNTETEGTSRWANAKANSEQKVAYFVWIPRYSYKIIYFDTPTNRNNYREDNTNTTGIIGYSTRYGMVDITNGIPKIVEGTEPVNIIGTVKTTGYQDYIPHPAFEFDGAKSGIWVGKYEPSGNKNSVTIRPNIASLRNLTVSDMFSASQTVKQTYQLTENIDTHMMKNTEWGAVAYLTQSKYGRNGTEITYNNSKAYITGNAKNANSLNPATGIENAYNTQRGILASTTGNIHGIYDISGGAAEYVAGYINNSTAQSSNDITNLRDAVLSNSKYADIYDATNDSEENNYNENRNKYGVGLFETSTISPIKQGWHQDYALYPNNTYPIFTRGGQYDYGFRTGIFYFGYNTGRCRQKLQFPCSVYTLIPLKMTNNKKLKVIF